MKDKNALFLMQAIGELSEETVAEAKRPAAIKLRYLAAAIAAVVVAVFITAALITAPAPDEPEQMVHVVERGGAYLDKPATPDQIGETATQPPTEAPTEAAEPTELTQAEATAPTDAESPTNSTPSPEKPTASPRAGTEREGQRSAVTGYLFSRFCTVDNIGGRTVYFNRFIGEPIIEYDYYFTDDYPPIERVALLTSLEQADEFMSDLNQYGFVLIDEEHIVNPSVFDTYALLALVRSHGDHTPLYLSALTVKDGALYPKIEPIPSGEGNYLYLQSNDIIFYFVGQDFVNNVTSIY